ncbi:hypothetical protein ACKI1J_32230 [Streptomyces scabiei]
MTVPERSPYPIPFRLRWHRWVDRVACWLIDRRQHRMAAALWRAFRMF